MQKTQKSITLLLFVLILLFTGCTANPAAKSDAIAGSQILAANTTKYAAANAGSTKQSGTDKNGSTGTKKNSSGNSGSTSTKKNSSGNSGNTKTAAPTTTASAASTAKWQGNSGNLIPTSSPSSHRQTTTKHTHTLSKTVTCTVTVECKNLQGRMDQLKPGHQDFVPADGYIIHTESRTVTRGSSAFDVLQLACNAHGVPLTVKKSSYGMYIAGINNLDEKDCGATSGWMYKVNGTPPMISADGYKMKDGDNLVFYYVCTTKDR